MLIVKNIKNKIMYNMQELCLHFVELIFTKLVSLIFSSHSSINLSTNLFLHLQFSESKYSPKSHDLSHSHSQLLGFQEYPLWHTPYQSVLYVSIDIYHHSNVVYYYKHLHLIYIYTYTFHD